MYLRRASLLGVDAGVCRLLGTTDATCVTLVGACGDRGLHVPLATLPTEPLADFAVDLAASFGEGDVVQFDLEGQRERELAELGAGFVVPLLLVDAGRHDLRASFRDELHRRSVLVRQGETDEGVDQQKGHQLDGLVLLDRLANHVLGAIGDTADLPPVVVVHGLGETFGSGQGRNLST